MTSPNGNFETFFNTWMNHQESLFQQLLVAIAPENAQNTELHKSLIAQIQSHYKLYYMEKMNATRDDAFVFLNPPWFSSFERTLLWLGEFKPSMIFKLIDRYLVDLTPDQRQRIEQVKYEARRQERALTETMAKIQESLASPPILNLARRHGRLIDGEVSEMEAAVEMLKMDMIAVMESADALRGWTVANVVGWEP